jgi:hypothetical protein
MKDQDTKHTKTEGQKLATFTPLTPIFVLLVCLVFDCRASLLQWPTNSPTSAPDRSAQLAALLAADLYARLGSSLAAAGKYAVEEINASANTPDYISAPPEVLISTSDCHVATCGFNAASRKQRYAVLLATGSKGIMGGMNSIAIGLRLIHRDA